MNHSFLRLLLCAALLLPAACRADSVTERPYWQQKATLYEILPASADDIIFFGNSITDGGEWAELFGMPNVKNRGISGDVVNGLRQRLDAIVKGKPAKVFIMIGINDISHGISADSIAADYARLVWELRRKSPATKVYLQSVLPVDNTFKRYKNMIGRDHLIAPVNDRIKQIADEEGCTYIDLWPLFLDNSTGRLNRKYTNDGLHINGQGYMAWAEYIRRFVTE